MRFARTPLPLERVDSADHLEGPSHAELRGEGLHGVRPVTFGVPDVEDDRVGHQPQEDERAEEEQREVEPPEVEPDQYRDERPPERDGDVLQEELLLQVRRPDEPHEPLRPHAVKEAQSERCE